MDIALFTLFSAAFLGFIGPKGTEAKAFAAIAFPIALVLFATLAGYVLGVNPKRILALVGIATVVFVAWIFLSPNKRAPSKSRGKP